MGFKMVECGKYPKTLSYIDYYMFIFFNMSFQQGSYLNTKALAKV